MLFNTYWILNPIDELLWVIKFNIITVHYPCYGNHSIIALHLGIEEESKNYTVSYSY